MLTRNRKFFFFFIVVVTHVACWLLLKPVWPFSDDICYVGRAQEFFSPNFQLTQNEFQNRFGVYIPAGLLFYFFGATPYTIGFWPLVAGILTSCSVFVVLCKWQRPIFALLAALLISLNIMVITYSIALFPDLIVTCFSTIAVLACYQARASDSKKMGFPFLIVFSLFMGLLTKIIIVLIFPFFGLLFLVDCFKNRHLNFWKQVIFSVILFTGVYFCIYYIATDDPFYRWKSIKAFNKQTTSDGYIRSYLNATYTNYFPAWINAQLGYLFIVIFAFFSVFTLRIRKLTDLQFYLSLFVLLLLSEYIILFHTETYGFLFRQERIWMLLIPPLSILSVYFFYQASKKQFIIAAICLLILGFVNYQIFGAMRLILFLLFIVSLVALYYLERTPRRQFVGSIFPFFVLAINFIYGNTNYRVASLQSGNIIKEELEQMSATGNKIILCDEIFAGTHRVYNNGKEYDNLTFYPFSKYDSLRNNKVYVLINQECDKIPEYIKNDSVKWKVEYDKKKLLIYSN